MLRFYAPVLILSIPFRSQDNQSQGGWLANCLHRIRPSLGMISLKLNSPISVRPSEVLAADRSLNPFPKL